MYHKNALFQCYDNFVDVSPGDTLHQGIDLVPTLVQTFDKAAVQQQMVAEAATCACLISKLLTVESLPGESFVVIQVTCLIVLFV